MAASIFEPGYQPSLELANRTTSLNHAALESRAHDSVDVVEEGLARLSSAGLHYKGDYLRTMKIVRTVHHHIQILEELGMTARNHPEALGLELKDLSTFHSAMMDDLRIFRMKTGPLLQPAGTPGMTGDELATSAQEVLSKFEDFRKPSQQH